MPNLIGSASPVSTASTPGNALARATSMLDRHVGGQLLELHLDELERLVRDPLVGGRHCGNRIADVTNLLGCERLLVLTDRQDAELDRQRVTREHREYPG